MRKALALAARGGRAVGANPQVGCLLVRGGKIVGRGWHKRFGGPHAEPMALAAAGKQARGATAYVTMEPCCGHRGKKTPPCAPALVAAGVARVVAAVLDPNPAVAGGGLRLLRRAGVKVSTGILAAEGLELNKGFFARMKLGRPHVLLKTALSLDGRAAAEGGRSRWVTGKPSRSLVHRLRAQVDAVLVGVGTVLADDPALTSHGAGPDPLRVVLDRRLRTPVGAKLLKGGATLIFTAAKGRRAGAETLRFPAGPRGLELKPVLKELARRGIGTLLVEGGPTVHASFLRERLVDEAFVFLAPKLLAGSRDPNKAPRLKTPRLRRVGDDWLVSGRVSCSPA